MVRGPDLFFPAVMLTPADIQTLARLTGKDFSGPVPVIKAPTPLRMVEDDVPPQQKIEGTPAVRKKSRTPGVQLANEEEVLGDVDDYEDGD
jgi:transcription factor TFIIIB component B''